MIAKPTLEGARVTLRPLGPDDLEAYHPLLSDDAEARRLTGTQRTFTRADAVEWLGSLVERDGRLDLAITRRDTRELIGEVVLSYIDSTNRSASLRILIGSGHTDRGYGSEAMRLLIDHAFEKLQLHRIELEVYVFNPRAIHVYEKLGFRQEGRRRGVLYRDGSYHDVVMMSLLEGEYQEDLGRAAAANVGGA